MKAGEKENEMKNYIRLFRDEGDGRRAMYVNPDTIESIAPRSTDIGGSTIQVGNQPYGVVEEPTDILLKVKEAGKVNPESPTDRRIENMCRTIIGQELQDRDGKGKGHYRIEADGRVYERRTVVDDEGDMVDLLEYAYSLENFQERVEEIAGENALDRVVENLIQHEENGALAALIRHISRGIAEQVVERRVPGSVRLTDEEIENMESAGENGEQ